MSKTETITKSSISQERINEVFTEKFRGEQDKIAIIEEKKRNEIRKKTLPSLSIPEEIHLIDLRYASNPNGQGISQAAFYVLVKDMASEIIELKKEITKITNLLQTKVN